MKLTAKFIVTLVLGMMIVLGVNAWMRLEREVGLFEAGMRRHAHALGHALGYGVASAWKTGGERSAIALVTDANEPSSYLDVRWVWLDAGDPAFLPRLPLAELEPVRHGLELSRRLPTAGGPGDLFTYVPVTVPGDRKGALQIAESLASQREVIHEIVRSAIWSMGVLVLVISGLAALLGAIFVGRPTRKLVLQAQRIGAGDLAHPIHVGQRDELGQIAAGMNLMCESLAQARDRITAETTTRVAAMEQLRHADRLMTVGKLASGIAHELGTPLNVVAGRGQMIAAGDSVGEEAAAGGRIIVEQANRMTQIIRQLLDFARPGRARRTRVDLNAVAAETAQLLRPLAQKKRITITLRAGDATFAELGERQIEQALTNLVVNALHATATGGDVTISVEQLSAQPPPDVGSEHGAYVRLAVADTGHGMAPEIVARVFEPFFTTKDVGEGTGLGLSVTYGIVREHGGWIDVQSEPGRGSTFSIFLPVAAKEGA